MTRRHPPSGPPAPARDGEWTVASFAGSLRFLRVTWILWIASFLCLYSIPSWLFVFEADGHVSAHLCSIDRTLLLHTDSWMWDSENWLPGALALRDGEIWIPAGLALIVPAALCWLLARRAGSPFVLRRAAEGVTHDYRSPRPWRIDTSPRVVRRRVALHAGRMGLALALSFGAVLDLMGTSFHQRPAMCCICSAWAFRSVPEYLFFTSLLLAVAMAHVPLTSRVLGKPPRPPRGRG